MERSKLITLDDILFVNNVLEGTALMTPLKYLYTDYQGFEVWAKMENLQKVRSFKLRGAYVKMHAALTKMERLGKDASQFEAVCASTGNHAQGVGFSCDALGVRGAVFMPETTVKSKVEKTRKYENVEVRLTGRTFDDAYAEALRYADEYTYRILVPPFADKEVILGQAVIGYELCLQADDITHIVGAVGGGGMMSGIGSCMKILSPSTKMITVQPEKAAAMTHSLNRGYLVELDNVDDTVADALKVRKASKITYDLLQDIVEPEGRVLVSDDEIISAMSRLIDMNVFAEPSAAATLAGVEAYRPYLKEGDKVVCIISGGLEEDECRAFVGDYLCASVN